MITAGSGLGGDGLALLDVFDVAQAVEVEGRVAAPEERAGLGVEALGVHLEDLGDLHRERRVDVDRDRRQRPGARRCFRAKTISCARSSAKAGMITLPPRAKVRRMTPRGRLPSSMGSCSRSP
jgi:hypothetical protein